MTLSFKKLDAECYYVTDGTHGFNAYVRYSKANKHYAVDVCERYFEVRNVAEFKNKVQSMYANNQLSTFEI